MELYKKEKDRYHTINNTTPQLIKMLCDKQKGGQLNHSHKQYTNYLKYCKYRSKYLDLKQKAKSLGMI